MDTLFDDTLHTPVRFLFDAGHVYDGGSDRITLLKCRLEPIEKITMAARSRARWSSNLPATHSVWPLRSAKVSCILLLAVDSAMLAFMSISAAMRPFDLGQRPRVSNELFCISTECCCTLSAR